MLMTILLVVLVLSLVGACTSGDDTKPSDTGDSEPADDSRPDSDRIAKSDVIVLGCVCLPGAAQKGPVRPSKATEGPARPALAKKK